MKFKFLLFFFISIYSHAQKPCDFTTNVTDSLGTYMATKDYLVYEKNFAGNSSYIFYSIIVADGAPSLTVQLIEKSNDFIKARCFDRNSKLYMQLNSGKIVTFFHIDEESCGTMVKDDKGFYNRVTSGYFAFRKEDYAELKISSVSLIKIKFTMETSDYLIKKEFKSELNNDTYDPENYFINYLHCIDGK